MWGGIVILPVLMDGGTRWMTPQCQHGYHCGLQVNPTIWEVRQLRVDTNMGVKLVRGIFNPQRHLLGTFCAHDFRSRSVVALRNVATIDPLVERRHSIRKSVSRPPT